MKMTLRKAHRLVKTLEQNLSVKMQVKVVHASLTETELRKEFDSLRMENSIRISNTMSIINHVETIRGLLQEKNAVIFDEAGESINSLLNAKAHIENRLRMIKQIAAEETHQTDDQKFSDVVRTAKDVLTSNSVYNTARVVTIDGYPSSVQNGFYEQIYGLKKELEEITDRLAFANNLLTIELPDDMIQFHRDLKIA